MVEHGKDRDYLNVSLSRLIFKPTPFQKPLNLAQSSIYKDQDMVLSKEIIQSSNQKLWHPEWVKKVLEERELMRQRIVSAQNKDKVKDAYEYFELIEQKLKSGQYATESDLGKASELVLQEIFGVIAAEKESEWDKSEQIPD